MQGEGRAAESIEPARIRIVIADDHEVVRRGLESLIHAQADMRVVARTGTGPPLLELHGTLAPDVTLVDVSPPGAAGVAAIRGIRAGSPEARLIAMSFHRADEAAYQALRAGARGYLVTGAGPADVAGAVRVVHAGGNWIPDEVAARMAEHHSYQALTARELDVLKRMALGLSNAEIGRELGTTTGTARNRVARILSKLRTRDRTHAVTVALQRGLLWLEDLSVRGSGRGASRVDRHRRARISRPLPRRRAVLRFQSSDAIQNKSK